MNESITDIVGRIRPGRKIDGISAVFLPFDKSGRIDFNSFQRHLLRTTEVGLRPAVNMDTGFGPMLAPKERLEVLRMARKALGAEAPFVAGAMPFGHEGDPLAAYDAEIAEILNEGGTPIIFQSEVFKAATGREIAELYGRIVEPCQQALAFEIGPMFADFGRIYDIDAIKRLVENPKIVGLKHSSLSRRRELKRLAVRDRERPEFRIYTGNDLAIDMVMYGSDYLLGLSTFEPEAFALRDRLWMAEDPRFFELNDALQALGRAAFRDPVAAYKDSAAVYLALTGQLGDVSPHPSCARRPAWEAALLRPLAADVSRAVERVKSEGV
ncbi:MAG: dihydrodipicolinate synthase family protein [Planctomycetota bacterium]|jgi:dihydrodipicolinate synthase/N-acetylneuraminate lyase